MNGVVLTLGVAFSAACVWERQQGPDRGARGVHATSLLLPSGKEPPLWDDLITGKEGMVIRGETGG